MVTALIRAHHTRHEPRPLFVDPWGDVLVPQNFKDRLAERAELLDPYVQSIPSYASVVVRSRYAEDALEKAVRAGVAQYVSVGAGFDSFSLRRPAYAADLQVFEVDHPATQVTKRRQLADNNIAEPALTHFIAADLGQETLRSALQRSPFRLKAPTFFAWLGVTIYLTREANSMALRGFAECGGPGSLLVFTYVDEKVFDPANESEGFRRMRANAERVGEPFISGFKPAEMPAYLASLGLELVEDLGGDELSRRYAGASHKTILPMSADSHFALARVV